MLLPLWGTSVEYHNIYFHGEIRKISLIFCWKKTHLIWSYIYTALSSLPDTTVTGPWILESFCLLKFFTTHFKSVVFPTLGGPTIPTITGGGSTGVLSTTGMCCFLVLISWVLWLNKFKRTWQVEELWWDYFSCIFIKTCCGYSLEAPHLGKVLLMSTNYMFYGELKKTIPEYYHQILLIHKSSVKQL